MKPSRSPPEQTKLLTTTAVYELSAVVTDFRSEKESTTYTSNLLPLSASLTQKTSRVFPNRSTTTTNWSMETNAFIHKTSAIRSKAFPKSGTFPTQNLFTRPLQSTFGSFWSFGNRKASTSIYLKEEHSSISTLPTLSPLSVKPQLATSILNDNGKTVITSSSFSASRFHALSPPGNSAESTWAEVKHHESVSESFQRNTKQSGQAQFAHTTLSYIAASSHHGPQLVSKNSVLKQTKEVILKANSMNISRRLSITNSDDFLLPGASLDSILVSTPSTDVLHWQTVNNPGREWSSSRPSLSSDAVRNNNHGTSSYRTALPYGSERATVILQISSYRHHTRVDSKQVSSNSSVSQFLKQNVTSPSEIALPVLPTSRLSTTTLEIQPENPFSIQASRGRSRSTVNFAASLSGSSLKGQSNTIEGKARTETFIALRISQSIHSTLHTTAGNSAILARRRDPSSKRSVVMQTNALPTQWSLPNPTYASSSNLKDEPTTRTALMLFMTFASQPSQSVTKAVTSWGTNSGSETNAILSKKSTIHKWVLSPSVFANFPISSSFPSSNFISKQTVASEATSHNSDVLSTSYASLLSTERYSSSIMASKSTLKPMTFFATDRQTSASFLDNAGFIVGTSSFQYMKSTESIQQTLPLVSTKMFPAEPSLSLQIGTTDTSTSSTLLSTAIIAPSPSSSNTIQITSGKMNSQPLHFGNSNVTLSIQHLGRTKNSSNRVSPTSYKNTALVTATLMHPTIHPNRPLSSSNVTCTSDSKMSDTVTSTAHYRSLLPFTSTSSVTMKNTTLKGFVGMRSAQLTGKPTFGHYPYTTVSRVTHSRNTFRNRFSSVSTTATPTSIQTPNSSVPYKVFDGSLIIRNRVYHENLSNPSTVMFKTLAGEVEATMKDIISLNNTNVLDVKVTSFRNGSVIAAFYMRVRFNSTLSDQEYVLLLSEANRTLWRSFYVTNITVTSRKTLEGSSAPSKRRADKSFSKAVIIATLTVLGALLIAVAAFAAYFCKKKAMCNTAQVKPSE